MIRARTPITALFVTLLVAACMPSVDDLDDRRSCGDAEKACLDRCVRLDDPTYGCGSPTTCEACAFPNARASCRDNQCAIAICEIPFDDCDGNEANGCETNTDTNVDRCGLCGNSCRKATPPANGSPVCRSGVCGVACNAGFGDCDNNAANGCEVDLSSSAQNCGQCGHPCTGQCTQGQCT